jgi:uncharacterized membrane protein
MLKQWFLLFIVILAAIFSMIAFNGCSPQQSATQQIIDQGGTPFQIAQAIYLDAQRAYINVLASYLPYKAELEESNQKAADDIKYEFNRINDLLNEFKEYAALGEYQNMDTLHFKGFLNAISIRIAKEIERGN